MITVENNRKYTQYPNTITMLEKIENVCKHMRQCDDWSDEDLDLYKTQELQIATALMRDSEDKAVKIAKIILAAKGIGDIHIKIE